MELDFESKDEIADFTSVPPGTYVCQIAEVRAGTTRAGDERWALRLVVAEGEYTGRAAAWDGLVFSSRGRARVRRVLAALGLPTRGRITIEPADLEGRRALVEVRNSEYTHPSGDVIRRNEVPYDGYRSLATDGEGADASDDEEDENETELPF